MEELKFIIPLLLAMIGVAVAIGGDREKISAHEKRIEGVEKKVSENKEGVDKEVAALKESHAQDRITLAVLDERTKAIGNDTQEIKADIKNAITQILNVIKKEAA